MAYGKVHETFWDDPLLRGLSEQARHLMLYLITCRHKNRLGCYVLDFGYAAADIQWSPDKVSDTVAELCSVDRIRYDASHRVVLIPRYLKHNTMENHKVVAGALSEMAGLPDTPLLAGLLEAVTKYSRPHYAPLAQALSNRIGNGIPNDTANGNGIGMPYRGTSQAVAVAVSVAVTGTVPEPEPSTPPDGGAEETPSLAAVAPAHTHEEPAAPPPPAENGATGGNDQQQLIEAMAELVKDHARQRQLDDVAKRTFFAGASPIVRGQDFTAWADHTGTQVPWPDRPRLLELALARVSAGSSPDLRKALRYVIPQQYDPFERTRSNRPPADSEAGQVAAELPQDTTAKRNGKLTRADGHDPERAEREAERREIQRLADWEREHQEEAERLRTDVALELSQDPKWKGADEVAIRIAGAGLYRRRVRERLEGQAVAAGGA
jgi:hypothetical protein